MGGLREERSKPGGEGAIAEVVGIGARGQLENLDGCAGLEGGVDPKRGAAAERIAVEQQD